ncbi:MAG: pilus assembly protein TadG-related protein [Erythrobacter sp.]|nr:pilus assembly protein TadG-related protein [Erythrobacter sp.]
MQGGGVFIDFVRDRNAAIAPLYALALFALIMIAGVGWDYSRMATMDSELQNAADQAALAAATQLTGVSGAQQRAREAATNYFTNETKLANDGAGRAVGGLTFEFFQSWDHASDTPGPAATSDANARYVRVTVGAREAFYALTAIGGALSSGDIAANAVATLEAAACNIPPVMVCAPTGDPGWPRASDIGSAVDMREGPQNTESFTPGNFDLLNIDYDGLAANDQNRTLGLNSDLLGCTAAQLQTDPGRRTPQTSAVNTRFGIYPNGNNFSCQSNGNFCPAEVTRSDLVRAISVGNLANAAADICDDVTAGELVLPPETLGLPKQGFPLDTCQTDGLGGCLSFGNGNWPAQSYMDAVHPELIGLDITTVVPDLDGKPGRSRYEVYEWERKNPAYSQPAELARVPNKNGNGGTIYCSAPRPIEGTPVPATPTQKDRRILPVAVVDCAGNSGRFDVNTFKFVDMFLLGPMIGAEGSRELRAEIVGPARRADGGSGFQTFGRKKAVLVR